MKRRLHPIVLALLLSGLMLFPATACDLPQNASDDADVISDDDTESVESEPRSWRLLKLIDRSILDETEMPGLDLDAVVVMAGDQFVSAGCKGLPVLYESDTQGASEVNAHDDPSLATLSAVDGELSSGGFVSLASGVLTCELPIPVWTGSTITIIDVASDGDESWDLRLAQDATGEYEDAAIDMMGTATFVVP